MEFARRELGAAMDEPMQKSFREVRKKKRSSTKHAVVPMSESGRFAGVQNFVEQKTKEAVTAACGGKLGLHSVYVCGEPWIDASTQTVSIAFSSQNLLLNAYRQAQCGLPSILQVDTTYRLVLEGHNNMLFGTVDAAQHFHVVGYGVCSSEDTAAHAHVMKCLRNELESIVEEHRQEQKGI